MTKITLRTAVISLKWIPGQGNAVGLEPGRDCAYRVGHAKSLCRTGIRRDHRVDRSDPVVHTEDEFLGVTAMDARDRIFAEDNFEAGNPRCPRMNSWCASKIPS